MPADPPSFPPDPEAVRPRRLISRYGPLIRTFGFAGLTNLTNFFAVAVMLVAARVLGREDFGALAYAQSLAIVAMTLVSFGLDLLVTREVSRRKGLGSHYFYNHMIWVMVLWTAILAALAVGVMLFEPDPLLRWVILLTAAAWGLRVITLSAQVYFRAFDRFGRESAVALTGQTVYLVLCLVTLVLAPDLLPFVIVILAARSIGYAIALVSVGRTIGVSYRLDPRLVLQLQRMALPIGFSAALSAAYTQVDILILRSGLGFGLDEIGVYGAALKVYLALFMLPSTVTNVLLPRLSVSFADGDARRYRRLVWGGGALLFAVSLPMTAIGIVLSPWIMETVFGPEYASGTRVLQILFVAAMIWFQVFYARMLLVVIDRQRLMVWITLVGLAVRIGLVWGLSETWGIEGTAIAVVIAEAAMLASLWGYLALRRR
ncbi:MAG: flippase [Paracoccaceae bacterium]|nr:flippase [Paracoccaceae bacterium]